MNCREPQYTISTGFKGHFKPSWLVNLVQISSGAQPGHMVCPHGGDVSVGVFGAEEGDTGAVVVVVVAVEDTNDGAGEIGSE